MSASWGNGYAIVTFLLPNLPVAFHYYNCGVSWKSLKCNLNVQALKVRFGVSAVTRTIKLQV